MTWCVHAAKHEPPDARGEPSGLAEWTEFHEYIEALPEEERDVFDLLWYQGLTHAEAAEVLGVATKTVQRRWQTVCLKVHQRFKDSLLQS